MLTHLLDAQDGRGVALWNCIPGHAVALNWKALSKGRFWPSTDLQGNTPKPTISLAKAVVSPAQVCQ